MVERSFKMDFSSDDDSALFHLAASTSCAGEATSPVLTKPKKQRQIDRHLPLAESTPCVTTAYPNLRNGIAVTVSSKDDACCSSNLKLVPDLSAIQYQEVQSSESSRHGHRRSFVTPNSSDNSGQATTSNRIRRRPASIKDRIFDQLQRNAKSLSEHSISASSIDNDFCVDRPDRVFYGLPKTVERMYAEQRGIREFYDWQKRCIQQYDSLPPGRNLVISLPTSGGKTLVAEILILRELLCRRMDALLVLPFVSIVQEKICSLEPLGLELNFLVEQYAASKGKLPPIKRRKKKSVYVATIEKAYNLVVSLIEAKRIDQLGLVVIDELHMIGDGSCRGATIEQLVMLLKTTAASTSRLIGMSATLSNINEVAVFMNAEVFSDDYRPVKLTEYVKINGFVYEVNASKYGAEDEIATYARSLGNPKHSKDPDQVGELCGEVVPGASCLVFCPSKQNAENVAVLLTQVLPKDKLLSHRAVDKKSLYKALKEEGDGKICAVLQKCIPFGIAYHHSGLTTDERKLIQDAFVEGVLCIICCTSTLAAGVNLPAKRVILRWPLVGNRFISRQQYKQMAGRAGRAGLDEYGESFVIIKPSHKQQMYALLAKNFEECKSSLALDSASGLKSLALTAVGLQLARTPEELLAILQNSLLYVQRERTLKVDLSSYVKTLLHSLIAHRFIVPKTLAAAASENGDGVSSLSSTDEFCVSPLGLASFRGGIDCEVAVVLYKDIEKALTNGVVLINHLHLLFLVIPYDGAYDELTPNYCLFYEIYHALSESERRVLDIVGINEYHLAMRQKGSSFKQGPDEKTLRRMYLALILRQLWNESGIWEIALRFQLTRGFLQSLLQSTNSFACCILRFCENLKEFWCLYALLAQFIERLTYCSHAELIPLMKLPGVKKARAQALLNRGYKTVSAVAESEIASLVRDIEHLSVKQAKVMINSAKMLLQEQKEELLDKASELLGKSAEEFDKELAMIVH